MIREVLSRDLPQTSLRRDIGAAWLAPNSTTRRLNDALNVRAEPGRGGRVKNFPRHVRPAKRENFSMKGVKPSKGDVLKPHNREQDDLQGAEAL